MVDAARSVVCLHATDPATVFLSAWARTEDMTVADLERALYEDRSLIKHLSMRRTLFVFPRETLSIAQAAASERVATAQRGQLIRAVEKAGLHADGAAWLAEAGAQVVAALADGREARTAELREELPLIQGRAMHGSGKWATEIPVAQHVVTTLSAEGRIVRATNDGAWTASRPRWTAMEAWLGKPLDAPDFAEGTTRLVEAWLRAFGPGTAKDIKWWLGSTVAAVKGALQALDVVEVDVGGQLAYVLPDDVEPEGTVEPWGALLPGLDPTTMGWAERDWYLGPHKAQIFDSNGNAGPTAWWDGRIVGGWRQDADGVVELQLLEDVGADGAKELSRRAEELTAWLAGTRAQVRFPSPLSKA
ncbi:MAG: AlkZ family DNA glycosylase [Solirubrobacteraceae bacterium]|nr:AlkZ family DNA glycosylase [Solirubrobacteraceae bacterium]